MKDKKYTRMTKCIKTEIEIIHVSLPTLVTSTVHIKVDKSWFSSISLREIKGIHILSIPLMLNCFLQ